uniref:Core shell protein Gag P30 domain-containing protein n=1 Tax=Leptobrachium leishanense TaxID=445787 RepID=A0A8C5WC69_9ANUR
MPDGNVYKRVTPEDSGDEGGDVNQGATTRAANNIYINPAIHTSTAPARVKCKCPCGRCQVPYWRMEDLGQYNTHVPFTTTDLFNWKTHAPLYSTNPAAVASMIESVMLTHNPTWADCQQLMLTMFTTEERARINNSVQKILLAQAVEDSKAQPEAWAEEHYPKTDPKWPYNTNEGIAHLQTYRTAVIMGVKAFLERLLDAYRMYSPIDAEAVENQRLVNSSFVSQSQRDIRNKIQKMDGFLGKGISELVEIANKVFHNRDLEEKQEEIRKQRGHTGVVGYMGNGGGRG